MYYYYGQKEVKTRRSPDSTMVVILLNGICWTCYTRPALLGHNCDRLSTFIHLYNRCAFIANFFFRRLSAQYVLHAIAAALMKK